MMKINILLNVYFNYYVISINITTSTITKIFSKQISLDFLFIIPVVMGRVNMITTSWNPLKLEAFSVLS